MGDRVTSSSRMLELVRAAQSGSEEAMETLLKVYAPLIAKQARQLCRHANTNPCVSNEDLKQEASLLLIQLVKEFRVESGVLFGSYLKQKLRWRLHNYLRRERTRVFATAGLDSPEVEEIATEFDMIPEVGLDNPRLRAAFRQLSPRQRTVLVRTYWEEKTTRKVADELGVTLQAVGALQRRALRRLRETMCEEKTTPNPDDGGSDRRQPGCIPN
ncbi:MAG: sigma-70 family RNA polymerase sigma factor [Chloroflexota bacterium]